MNYFIFYITGFLLVWTLDKFVSEDGRYSSWETKPFEQYNVDKSFYLSEATKLVQSVINNQLTL